MAKQAAVEEVVAVPKSRAREAAAADARANEALAERNRALTAALASLDKEYGKGTIMRMGAGVIGTPVEAIPTGSLALDAALGIGGVPRGRVVEIYGPESSGKTTLALSIAAQCQKLGGVVLFIDAEHAIDTAYAAALGVDLENLYITQPDTGEQALEICEAMVRTGAIDLVIIDSVAALVPKAEIEGEMGDSHVGAQARLMSQALRKLTGIINRSHTCVIFINQIRMKIGVMYGSPETTTGGYALKFYCSVRLDIRRKETIKTSSGDAVGNRTGVKVVKNKMAPPHRTCEFDITYGKGISRSGEMLDMGDENKLVEKSGAWYSYKGERIGQGRENAKLFLEEHPETFAQLELELREKLNIATPKAGSHSVKGE